MKHENYRRSPVWKAKRRVQNLGAFAKWAKANPEEHKAVEERYRRENEQRNQ